MPRYAWRSPDWPGRGLRWLAPIGSRQAFLVDRFVEYLGSGPSAGHMVRVQNPIVHDERSEPQPDIALVKRANLDDRQPTPADVLWIVEVSDTTLEYDRDGKLALYARYGIPEVWRCDVKGSGVPKPARSALVQSG